MLKNRTFFFVLAVAALALLSCASPRNGQRACPELNMKGVSLRWGGINFKTGAQSGFLTDENSNLYKFFKKPSGETKTEKIGEISEKTLCRRLREAKALFLKIQALNAPGDSSNFVEYVNEQIGSRARAVWNVKFKTYGSREFRALFDSLNAEVKRAIQ